MIDLHSHVLPAIDDGPADLDKAVEMLAAYARDGVTLVAATPHLRHDFPGVHPAELAARRDMLEEAARAAGVTLPAVVGGGELALSWALGARDDELALVSLAGRGSDLLVETPFGELGPGFDRALMTLRDRGYRLVLAHPELNPTFRRAPDRLSDLVAAGILVQVTARSLLKSPRRSRSSALAWSLVREGLCHVLASDAHSGAAWRPPELTPAVAAAAREVGARAEWMSGAAPAAVLAGAPLPEPPRVTAAPRGLARLRRRAAA